MKKMVKNKFLVVLFVLSILSISFVSAGWSLNSKEKFQPVQDEGYLYSLTGVNSAPNTGTFSPTSGESIVNQWTIFTASYSDSDGWNDLVYGRIAISKELNYPSIPVMIDYLPNYNMIYIYNSNSNGISSGNCTPGSNVIIENANARIDCAKSSVSTSSISAGLTTINGPSFTLALSISFKESYVGDYKTWLYAKDYSGVRTPWAEVGNWKISSAGTSESSATCTDTDYGKAYYELGSCTDSSGNSMGDGCIISNSDNNGYLREITCDSRSGILRCEMNDYKCPNGCSNGTCITCGDSDNGINYNVKGIVNGMEAGMESSATDFCDGNKVREFSCGINPEGNRWNYKWDDYLCPYGCSDGACLPEQQQTCQDLINKVKYPADFVDDGIGYSFNWNGSYYGTYWINGMNENYNSYYSDWHSNYDGTYNHISYNLMVFDNKNIDLEKFFEEGINNPGCTLRYYWTGNKENKIFICNWNAVAEGDNYGSRMVFWLNKNVLTKINVYTGKELSNEEILKRRQEKLNEFIDKLADNQGTYVGGESFVIQYPLSRQIEKSLGQCPSEISTETCSPCWNCKLEPAICPPHGYQTRTCVDSCCNKPQYKEEITCSPGICAGCYVPRWYGWDVGNNVCIPYGTRLSQTRSEDDERIEEGYQDGPSIINATIYDEGKAYLFIKQNEKVLFDQGIYPGAEYELDFTSFGGAIIRLRIDKIVPATETEKGYILITVMQNFNAYCDYTGRIEQQKIKDYQNNWAKCQNSYECESNFCSSGECIEITQMIKDAKGFKATFVKVLCKLANLFNVEKYEQCVGKALA